MPGAAGGGAGAGLGGGGAERSLGFVTKASPGGFAKSSFNEWKSPFDPWRNGRSSSK